MSQLVDYKQKYNDTRKELIETKARLVTIESMYWKQQKLLNDDQAETDNYKDLYQKAKQEIEVLKKRLDQYATDPTDYKELYESTVREKRRMIEKYHREAESYKTKYEQAKEALLTERKEHIKLRRCQQSEREKKLRSKIYRLEKQLKERI